MYRAADVVRVSDRPPGCPARSVSRVAAGDGRGPSWAGAEPDAPAAAGHRRRPRAAPARGARDAAALPALYDDPDVARHTPIESPFDAAAARRYLERAAGQTRAGQALHLAVTLDGGAPLGEVLAFVPRHATRRRPAAGRRPHPRARLRRRARRTAGRASRRAPCGCSARPSVRDLGVTRLVLRIDAGNVASERVAAACGYV